MTLSANKEDTPNKAMTNEDEIKAMNTEQLADFLSKLDGNKCGKKFWVDWLKKER